MSIAHRILLSTISLVTVLALIEIDRISSVPLRIADGVAAFLGIALLGPWVGARWTLKPQPIVPGRLETMLRATVIVLAIGFAAWRGLSLIEAGLLGLAIGASMLVVRYLALVAVRIARENRH